MTQKAHSIDMLKELQYYFGCGNIQIDNRRDDTLKFQVSLQKHLIEKVIPHFDEFPLQTSKFLDYKDFKESLFIVNKKQHIIDYGIKKITEIKLNINKGRS